MCMREKERGVEREEEKGGGGSELEIELYMSIMHT